MYIDVHSTIYGSNQLSGLTLVRYFQLFFLYEHGYVTNLCLLGGLILILLEYNVEVTAYLKMMIRLLTMMILK